MRRYFHRHQTPVAGRVTLKAGMGATLSLGVIAEIGDLLSIPLLVAPLGSSAVLIFSDPGSTSAQPANVIGGHLLATLIGWIMYEYVPHTALMACGVVGLVIAAMTLLRLMHPPAGATPLILFLGDVHPEIFVSTLLAGCVALVGLAIVFHRLPPAQAYPALIPQDPRSAADRAEEQAGH